MIDGYGIQEDLRKKKQKHAVGKSYHRIGHISTFPKRWGGGSVTYMQVCNSMYIYMLKWFRFWSLISNLESKNCTY